MDHRANRFGCAVVGGLALALAVLTFGSWDETLILSAGHLGQLIIAGIFLFRGLTGVAVVHGVERWLYAIVGWTLLLQAMQLCWGVAWDPDMQDRYLEGKGGCDNDFVRIADAWGWRFEHVAIVHLWLSAAVPLVAWAVWRWRDAISTFAWAVVRRDPAEA